MKKPIISVLLTFLLFTGCKADTSEKINNGISSNQIIKTIDKGKPVLVSGMIITDDLNFAEIKNQIVFSSSQRIANVDVPVTFINCIFMGKVNTNGKKDNSQVNTHFKGSITFEACDFRADAVFDNMIVDGMANFTGAIFREKALFNNVTFKGRQTYFTAFTSEKLFSMQESKIEGAIDFFKGIVTGRLSFQSTDFWGEARFSDLDCNGKSEFSLTNFRSDALFTYANFGNEFRMSNTTVTGRLDMISVDFQTNAWLTNAVFNGKVNFTKTKAKANFDLSGSLFVLGKPEMDEFEVLQPGLMITNGTKCTVNNEFEEIKAKQ